MKQPRRITMQSVIITGLAVLFFAYPVRSADPTEYIIVKMNAAAGNSRAILEETLTTAKKTKTVVEFEALPVMNDHEPASLFRLQTQSEKTSEILTMLRASRAVAYAERDYPVYAFYVPNDPSFGSQWHFEKVGLQAGWDFDTTAPLYGGDPAVTVAVIDTGLAFENFTDGATVYQKAPDFSTTAFSAGYDFVNDDAHPNDDNGHGTHVAATIAESTDNAIAAAGIAFQSTLMPIKVLDRSGVGLMSNVASGIDFAVANGADVINLSLGSNMASQTLQEAVQRALDAGIVVVAASGNDANTALSYPALYPGVISVSAIGRDDILASYSNHGTGLSLTAPGGDDGEYVWQQGFSSLDANNLTSQATPHVSGAAALLLARGVAGSNVKALLETTATDLGPAGYDTQYGHGRLNIPAAFSAFLNDTTPPVTTLSTVPPAPDGLQGYFITLPTLTLSSADSAGGAGVSHIYYHWDDDPLAEYSGIILQLQGTHQFSYYAVDAAGNTELQQTVTLMIDSTGPTITLTSPALTANNPHLRISGTVTDDTTGVASLIIDGETIPLSAQGTFSFSKLYPVGKNSMTFVATDAAGKSTTLVHQITVTAKARILTGPGPGGGPQVVVSSNTGRKIFTFFGLPKSFTGGINVASGDFNGDGTDELVVTAGPGGTSQVRIYNKKGKLLGQFSAFEKAFRGGLSIACADFDRDGKDEIVVGRESHGTPTVKIFTDKGKLKKSFLGFSKSFRGGISLATGDTNGDGIPEILVGAGAGGGPQIRLFSSAGKLHGQFRAYVSSFRGGVRVASADIDQDGKDDIIAAPGTGGGPQIRVFRANGKLMRQFFAFKKSETSGLKIAAADVNGDGKPEIIAGSGRDSDSYVRVFSQTGKLLRQFRPYAKGYRGGITIATGFTD